ncbi:MAG: thioredoxin domain-containing protein [Candidatus Sumerlaeaceae bacterium]
MSTSPDHKHTNRLANETSPYLLQHAHNPVDWYPWGQEAFDKARAENKPLLISIGYSACHWCHVMERESFEDEEIAKIMNETAVCVKVDREERPDVDTIYMNACMAMTGQGGWPLNAFVTPDLKPFFVGTYFPPDNRYGRPGWRMLLERIREAWVTEGSQLTEQAEALHRQVELYTRTSGREAIDSGVMELAVREASTSFDLKYGGFGNAPKFPPDTRLAMLLAAHHDLGTSTALEIVTKTLDAMAYGGMYDQIGGGFARYSVDAMWLIPHFEKMLYNQALLVPVYLDAFLLTERPLYRRIAIETIEWVLRELTSPESMFFCAYDADSEGEEGKFYVWTPGEVEQVLGKADGEFFCEYYGITERGNFEHGTSNPHVSVPPEEFAKEHQVTPEELIARIAPLKLKMRDARSKRVWPGLDDKCLTSWNGLMITALCRGFQVTGDERYLDAARKSADAILTWQCSGEALLRSFSKGQSRIEGVLDDYAFLIGGLIDLYESCFDLKYLNAANGLADGMVRRFLDADRGGFYFTAGQDASLISRTRETHDGALPSGNSVAILCLLRLAVFFDRTDFRAIAQKSIEADGRGANSHPSAFASLVLANRFASGKTPQIVIAGADPAARQDLVDVAWRTYLPSRSIVLADTEAEKTMPVLHGKTTYNPTAYVCFQYTCQAPVHTVVELQKQLGPRIP